VRLDRPRLAPAFLLGLAAAVATAAVYALLASALDLPLLLIWAVGGWLIGTAVKRGAWSGRPHGPSSAPEVLAIAIAVGTWLAGMVAAWLLALLLLPGSSRSFVERLSDTPFVDWLGPQLFPGAFLGLLVAAGLAWIGARSSPDVS
jgi:hypothetical protein